MGENFRSHGGRMVEATSIVFPIVIGARKSQSNRLNQTHFAILNIFFFFLQMHLDTPYFFGNMMLKMLQTCWNAEFDVMEYLASFRSLMSSRNPL